MLISPILKDTILYINLHAEQCYYGTFQADTLEINKNLITGIFETELNKTVLDNIYEFIKIQKRNYSHLVLDFSNLKTAQKNLDKLIINIKNEAESVILTNIHVNIIDKLSLESYCGINNTTTLSFPIFYIRDGNFKPEINIDNIRDVFLFEFEKQLIEITSDNNALHHSSSVYLSKFIDIKKMIVNKKYFCVYSIYWLALQMHSRDWKFGHKNKITLLCQNLNSSFIASILSSFLLLDVITFDHIGPINKVYNEIDKKIKQQEEYIVVTDVVCIGTEVRIAKNMIEFSGGKYIGNVALVRIMTMKEAERFNDTESVYEISKDKNPIEFEIKTALNI